MVTEQRNKPGGVDEKNRSYSEVARETLHLKVTLAEKKPCMNDLMNVKLFLTDKAVEAMEKGERIPIFSDNVIKSDGLYLRCSDHACATWLKSLIENGVPETIPKLVVIPHDEVWETPVTQSFIRVVTCISTRRDSGFILDAIAKMNPHLNTENWKITSRRKKGATKLTLFMRMDEHSYRTIQNQGGKINWFLGAVTVEQEKHKAASTKATDAPTLDNKKVQLESAGGKKSATPLAQPPSEEVWNRNQTVQKHLRKGNAGTSGSSNKRV